MTLVFIPGTQSEASVQAVALMAEMAEDRAGAVIALPSTPGGERGCASQLRSRRRCRPYKIPSRSHTASSAENDEEASRSPRPPSTAR